MAASTKILFLVLSSRNAFLTLVIGDYCIIEPDSGRGDGNQKSLCYISMKTRAFFPFFLLSFFRAYATSCANPAMEKGVYRELARLSIGDAAVPSIPTTTFS